MPQAPIRIAMWSGPRNISTAMMRAWSNRPDTAVIDEPLYAAYLERTGLDHPGRARIIDANDTNWRSVADTLLGPVPDGMQIWYQKQMAHHLLPEMGIDWVDGLNNCFLIRSPREVITSYIKVRADPTQADLGFVQQLDIFEQVRRRTGTIPPVLDSRDVLDNPRKLLTLLCESISIPFNEKMLRWPAGPRNTDGVWAPYWYAAVERSTGFQPYVAKNDPLPDHLRPLLEQCQGLYDELYAHRLGRQGRLN